MTHADWAHLEAGSPLRHYQSRALSELLIHLKNAGTRACLVAPPGAGKTRVALHAAAALQQPIEVRVPTTALVRQWTQRVEQNFVSVNADVSPPVRISTYASMGTFAANALVILDEAHHLLARWGEEVQQRLTAEHRVLGLTATPPHGSKGWDRFVGIVGTEPVVVDAPPLVRDGHLCPYQDLVWPVLGDIDDLPGLREAHLALDTVERQLGESLTGWTGRHLQEDLWQLTADRFAHDKGLLVALCRFRHALGRDLPNDLLRDPEFLAPPSLHDRAQILWAYDAEDARIKEAVRVAGFRRAGKGLVRRVDPAWQSLTASRSRVRGCIDVLTLEHRARGDGMRALVMTDRDTEGGRLSAREVLRALVSNPDTDMLDPILVTGSAFWVDDDVWPRIESKVPELPWRVVNGHHEVDVSKWSTADRIDLVTRLLSSGVTRCLVGTRHLLGEGWDCPPVNCVIDLTGIVAAVTTNQVRGRAFRNDPNDPSKVASIWDVITLVPGISDGGRMLEQLQQRHAHTFGINATGRIQAGVGRIDPSLTGSPQYVAAQVADIRARMTERVGEVGHAKELWRVGQSYRDQRVWRVEGVEARSTGVRVRTTKPKDPIPAAKNAWVRMRRKRWNGVAATGITGVSASLYIGSLFSMGVVPLATGIGIAATVLVTGALGGYMLRRNGQREAIIRAVAQAMDTVHGGSGELCMDGDRAWMVGDSATSRRFATAVAEVLGPIRYPRYLLLESNGCVWPVPQALGETRAHADAFGAAWAKEVGSGEVVYARQGRGRDLLIAAWKAGGRADITVIEDWE